VQERIAAYEQEILRQLGEMEEPGRWGQTAPPLNNANKAQAIKKRGQEAKRQALYRIAASISRKSMPSGWKRWKW